MPRSAPIADRKSLSARLQGRYNFGALTFTPSAEIIHFQDKSKTYIDSNGFAIQGVTVKLGRAVFGPEIGYTFTRHDGSTITPKLALKGLWNLEQSDVTGLNGGTVLNNRFRGRVEAGLTAQSADGMKLDMSGSYDGIGNGQVSGYAGTVRLRIPLN